MNSNILSSILSWDTGSSLLCSGLFGYFNPSGLHASLNLAFTALIRHSCPSCTSTALWGDSSPTLPALQGEVFCSCWWWWWKEVETLKAESQAETCGVMTRSPYASLNIMALCSASWISLGFQSCNLQDCASVCNSFPLEKQQRACCLSNQPCMCFPVAPQARETKLFLQPSSGVTISW